MIKSMYVTPLTDEIILSGNQGNTSHKIRDYTTENYNFLNNIDFTGLTKDYIHPNSELIEKLCLDFYDNADYYDLISFLNNRDLLFNIPLSYDEIKKIVSKLTEYYFQDYQGPENENIRTDFSSLFEHYIIQENSKKNIIKMIDVNVIDEIKRKLDEIKKNETK